MDKILIVDDNRQALNTLTRTLTRFADEFEVITADNGEKAIEELRRTHIDLLITDLVMPGIDGLSLLAHINEHYPSTLCIAMTGYATDNIVRMLPDNLICLMRKPFDMNDFIGIIRKSLKGKPPGGTMGGISVPSFLKLIEMEEKSCMLAITLPDNRQGVFLFKEGELYDAAFKDLTGEAAAIEMIKNGERAKFTLLPLIKQNIAKTITSPIVELLLKAAHRQDDVTAPSRRHSPHMESPKSPKT